MRLTPAYRERPEAGPRTGGPEPSLPTAEAVRWYVHGYARGNLARAEAILEALAVRTDNGSLRAVAARRGLVHTTLARWVGEVRVGVRRAARIGEGA